ncbi:hypothetical protein PMAYCL1PPCAC_04719, partial [Pristionchus mayeri]
LFLRNVILLPAGLKIDMPPSVLAKAICSIRFFQECENRMKKNDKPCGKLECINNQFYQGDHENPRYHGFFTCVCP